MTTTNLILITAPFMLTGLLLSERNGRTLSKMAFKSLLSSLFIGVAILQASAYTPFTVAVMIGLLLCLVGDVCLAIPGQAAFRIGLVAFLLGHVGYIAAFVMVGQAGLTMWAAALVALPASTFVYMRLLPFLNGMRRPVMGYVVVITLMVIAAGALFGAQNLPLGGRLLVLNGALAFYISDLFVARQRFVHETFYNRLIGLPLYYLGQFQIAYAVGLLG